MLSLIPRKTAANAVDRKESSIALRHRGVLLVNTGTPDAPDVPSVRRYLAEFLADPLVIRLPSGLRWMNGLLGRFIARMRAHRSVEKYRRIWTEQGSPLKVIMQEQVEALGLTLPDGWRVFMAMRYGQPQIADVLRQIAEEGIDELVVVPMYAQFSGPTTGTVIRELYRAVKLVAPHMNISVRTTWYDDIGYVNAQANVIADVVVENDLDPKDTHLLFSAHGLPVSYIKRGDPYARHIDRSVRLVTERLGWPVERTSHAFQSRLGPTEWLKPELSEKLAELAKAGDTRVVVCPISFSVDCLETLEEIDLQIREEFEELGGELFLCPALNTAQPFVAALKNLVLRGSQPVTSWGQQFKPLLEVQEEAASDGLEALALIGVSIKNRIGRGLGPQLRYSNQEDLSCIKRPHGEVEDLLRQAKKAGLVDEALIWNTCQRFEAYCWLQRDGRDNDACKIAQLRSMFLGNEPDDLEVNILFGADAWHHLMRTAVGLNSGLPGDKDVVEQFETAFRMANQAGTGGSHSQCLVEEVATLSTEVRAETAWGRHDPGYCLAAMSSIRDKSSIPWNECRHVVVGGSTTSRSVLETLFDRFGVPDRMATLVYRSHAGGQMKLLRKAIGNGKRVRVNSYSEQSVIDAIKEADVLHFGIDRNEPVLNSDQLVGIRDFAERPLTVIDFNTFGSTSNLESIDGVTIYTAKELEHLVDEFASDICEKPGFIEAVNEAESWIEQHSPEPTSLCVELPCIKTGEMPSPKCKDCQLPVSKEALEEAV